VTSDDVSTPLPPRFLFAAGLMTVALGIWGFARLDDQPGLAHIYRSFQLFVLETGDLGGSLPWQLEVARFAAAALTAASIGYIVLALSRGPIDRWRARRSRHHVIVCGLGQLGVSAASGIRAAGIGVVAVDADAGANGVERCRRDRIPVIVGDARDPRTLVRAGIGRADHLIVLTSGLESRGQIALAAVESTPDRSSNLGIHIELGDPHLAALFQAAQLSSGTTPVWRLEQLDLAADGARVMLDEHAAWSSEAHDAHVLVVGTSALGIALTRELRRRWRTDSTTGVLTVTLVRDQPGGSLPSSTDDVAIVAGSLDDLDQICDLTAAFVCVDDESAAFAAALSIVARRRGVPTVVRVERAAALGALLQESQPDLHPCSVDPKILDPATLLAGQQERIAQALHDFYRRTMATSGDASAAPWDALPDSLRASNRAQAADIATKLTRTGFIVVPDDGAPPDHFTSSEIDLLGSLEHGRWVDERRASGWTDGPRDPVAKTSPHLVAWDELDETTRDIDRDFVAALPDLLADAGLHVRRIAPGRPMAWW
jgi:hypothetical protein